MSQRKYLVLSVISLIVLIGLLLAVASFLTEDYKNSLNDPNRENSYGAGFVQFISIAVYGIIFSICALALLKLLGVMIGRNSFTITMIILFDVPILFTTIAICTGFELAIFTPDPLMILGLLPPVSAFLSLVFDIASLRSY
ncbi:MAG: hypothetical protein E7617_05160 [Ruminococcaceae bacterium]|nr:hypothetical protein [Oscillospiraceae bacterium]